MVTRPESVGLSSTRLETMDRVIKEKYLDSGKLPCAMTLVWRKGEIAHLGVQGLADVERKKSLAEDTIFRENSTQVRRSSSATSEMCMAEAGFLWAILARSPIKETLSYSQSATSP